MRTIPTRMDLKHMKMRRNENFRSFAQRWRAKAAQVQPPLNEDELIGHFLAALPYKFFDRLYTSGCQSFSHLVDVGEKVEWAMRNDKTRNKQSYGGYSQANKGPPDETDTPYQGRATMSQTPKPTKSSGKTPKSFEPKKKPPLKQVTFTPLPCPLSELLPMLLEEQMVAKEPPRIKPPKFQGYNETKSCIYHMGEKGHSVDNCRVLQYKVQALIDNEILKFDNPGSNMGQNHSFDRQRSDPPTWQRRGGRTGLAS